MQFYQLAQFFSMLEGTSSRLEMTNILHKMIKSCAPNEVAEVLYLSTGRVAPKYISLEFNMAEKLVVKALALGFGRMEGDIEKRYKETGDLGLVAEEMAASNGVQRLDMSVLEVYKKLREIAEYKGIDSQEKKIKGVAVLLKKMKPISCRYLIRIILGVLRLGIGEKTIIDALSWIVSGDKSLSNRIEKAYALCSDLGYVGKLLIKDGVKGLTRVKLTPGRPIFPQLSQRADSVEEIINRLKTPIIQPKLDGIRCQIHKWEEKGEVKVALFSRNLEVLTEMFPEVVEAAKKLSPKSFVLDSEVIGYNPETNEFMPFQQTIQRKRKYGVGKKAEEIPVYSLCFDLMFIEGKDLTETPYFERLKFLNRLLKGNKQEVLKLIETHYIRSLEEIKNLFDTYISEGLEGLMAKSENSSYQPGVRNYDWIKLRRSYEAKLADTIDSVVLGYYKGRGKQAKIGIGAFLVGVYNEKSDEFGTIAKVGTGVKEEEWRKIKSLLDKLVVKHVPPRVKIAKELMPDVLVYPKIVAVVRADEITKSPLHTAGRTDRNVGYALRFPRLEQFNRKDKSVEEITTVAEIEDMYQTQFKSRITKN